MTASANAASEAWGAVCLWRTYCVQSASKHQLLVVLPTQRPAQNTIFKSLLPGTLRMLLCG
jgi:hypothetical protein